MEVIAVDLGVMWTVPPRKVILRVLPASGGSVSWTLRPVDAGSTQWRAPISVSKLRLPLGEHRVRLRIIGQGGGDPVAVTLQTPFTMTAQLRRAWVLAALRKVAQKSIRRLRRHGRR